MGQFYQRTYGLEFAALRFSQTYGPGKTIAKWGGRAALSEIIEGAYFRRPVRVEKGGDRRNDILYTKDAAQAVYLACMKPEVHHSAYNIGTGVGLTLKDVADEVKRLIPEADIKIGPGLGPTDDPRAAVFDITRARKDLGFYPQFTLRKSVEDYIETLKGLVSA